MNIVIIDDTPKCPKCGQLQLPDLRWPDRGDRHCGLCGYVEYGTMGEERTWFQEHVGNRKDRSYDD